MPARPAEAFRDESFLRRAVMHEDHVGVAAPPDIERLAGAKRDHADRYARFRVKIGRMWPKRPDCSVLVVRRR